MKTVSEDRIEALYPEVRAVLEEALSLGGRSQKLAPQSPLLGALPELDSHAVVNVLMALEERFAITIEDDDVDAEVFATLRSLTAFAASKTGNE